MVAFLSPPGMRARRARKKRCWTIWPFSLIQQSFSYDCYSALGLSSEPSSLGVPCILRHNLFFSLKLWAPLTQVNITMYNQTRLGRTHFNLKEVSFCWYKCDIKLLPFFGRLKNNKHLCFIFQFWSVLQCNLIYAYSKEVLLYSAELTLS